MVDFVRRGSWWRRASGRTVPLGVFAGYVDHLETAPLAQVHDVVEALTGETGAGPVIGVDDAHLLDRQSALVVHQIVRRGLATVVLTVRTGEQAPDAITALWKDAALPRLELQPLSRDETTVLLETVLDAQVESATAERLWSTTRGNPLYLKQLLDDELAADRFVRRSGLWVWDTPLTVSPTLAELLENAMGRQPASVVGVLDVLAVADPLELDVLRDLADADAINAAETRGLITVDASVAPVIVRLAHPMFGEVRRRRIATLQLRRLRGLVVNSLGRCGGLGARQRVRRAVLARESDLEPDPTELCIAAIEALRSFDADLAERLAAAAVDAGGGRSALQVRAEALVNSGRGGDGAAVYADLAATAESSPERVVYSLAGAASAALELYIDTADEMMASVRETAGRIGFAQAYDSIATFVHATAGRCADAVAAASLASGAPPGRLAAFEALRAIGEVIAYGDLGRIDAVESAAATGYAVTAEHYSVANVHFLIGLRRLQANRYGGRLDTARAIADRHNADATGVPAVHVWASVMRGISRLADGDLAAARRSLCDALAFSPAMVNRNVGSLGHAVLTTTLAIGGDHAAAAQVWTARPAGVQPSEILLWETDLVLAQAWLSAAAGSVAEARKSVLDGAARESARGRPAREAMLLQTAAQFGDSSVADRLTELAEIVEGPRVHTAAAHAEALRDCDGEGLQRAAAGYEEFGDRIASADAAAQAAVLHTRHGRRGAAMSASATATRLASATGADTPALRAKATPVPLTDRQREVITLAATGLTNRDIAERLVMSVRTVEGHLFRASRRTGINTRAGLIALVGGARAYPPPTSGAPR
ncbi:MAG TPA: LuxR C-terminal-related transcriptional regulator [Aldersonia sp.]